MTITEEIKRLNELEESDRHEYRLAAEKWLRSHTALPPVAALNEKLDMLIQRRLAQQPAPTSDTRATDTTQQGLDTQPSSQFETGRHHGRKAAYKPGRL